MLFELATIDAMPDHLDAAVAGIGAWVADPDASGELLGVWRTGSDAGGRLLVLRSFAAPHDMTVERHRGLLSVNPFNVAAHATALATDSYASFPFLPPVRVGRRGDFHEWCIDEVRPGGLPSLLADCEAARGSRRTLFDHLVVGLYALDGPARIAHLWGFDSVGQRDGLRAHAPAAGSWPTRTEAGPIARSSAVVAVAQPGSPLH